jgi:hypothetical protein
VTDVDELLRQRDHWREMQDEAEAMIASINGQLEDLGIDPDESE